MGVQVPHYIIDAWGDRISPEMGSRGLWLHGGTVKAIGGRNFPPLQ